MFLVRLVLKNKCRLNYTGRFINEMLCWNISNKKNIETHLSVYVSMFTITQAWCSVSSVPSVVMIWTRLPVQDWRPPGPICATILVLLPFAKDTVENVVSIIHGA